MYDQWWRYDQWLFQKYFALSFFNGNFGNISSIFITTHVANEHLDIRTNIYIVHPIIYGVHFCHDEMLEKLLEPNRWNCFNSNDVLLTRIVYDVCNPLYMPQKDVFAKWICIFLLISINFHLKKIDRR